MNNVFGIGVNPAKAIVIPSDSKDRESFSNSVREILDMYVKGEIDVVAFGYVDPMGVPDASVGPFPDGLANDVLALGAAVTREANGEVAGAYDRVQNGA